MDILFYNWNGWPSMDDTQTLCGALVVTLAMLLRLINCRFIIIIIIKCGLTSRLPRSRAALGLWTFSCSGPAVWNSLLEYLRDL